MQHRYKNQNVFDISIRDLTAKQMWEIVVCCENVDTQLLIKSSSQNARWFGGLLALMRNIVSRVSSNDQKSEHTLNYYAHSSRFESDVRNSNLAAASENGPKLNVTQSFKSLYAAVIAECIQQHSEAAAKERDYYHNNFFGIVRGLFGGKARFKESAELIQLLRVGDDLKGTVDVILREQAKACIGPDWQYLANTASDRLSNTNL